MKFTPSPLTPGVPPPTFTLVRANLQTPLVVQLHVMAQRESQLTGRTVTVSDLIRDAVREWIASRSAPVRPPAGK